MYAQKKPSPKPDKRIKIGILEHSGNYRYTLNRILRANSNSKIIEYMSSDELVDKIEDDTTLIIADTDASNSISIEETIKRLREKGYKNHIVLFSSSKRYGEIYKRIGADGCINKFSDTLRDDLLNELRKY